VLQFGDRPNEPQRFQLLRNFSIISLSAFILATILLASFYRQKAMHDLVHLKEDNNVTLTRILANTLWPAYDSFLSSTYTLDDKELAQDPRIYQLRKTILTEVKGSSITKVKIFDLSGRTVFSTDFSQIGENKSQSSGFLAAYSGKIVSKVEHRDSYEALQGTLQDVHLLSSYIPIRDQGSTGEIVGVFEVYTDITSSLFDIDQTQRFVVLGSLLILFALYSALFLFVQRADTLLRKQYQHIQQSEGLYRQQARELEDTLTELRKAQSQMIQSEKMSALGQLVAGVAHEINNPINFIHGNLTYVQEYAQDLLKIVRAYQVCYPKPEAAIQAVTAEVDLEFIQDDLMKTLTSMQVGSRRIREIVRSLRNFSRLDEADIKPVDIHEGLESTLMILQHRLKSQANRPEIQIIREYGVLPLVECYAGALNQVFMNILTNAIDALEDKMQKQAYQAMGDRSAQITLRTRLINTQAVQIEIADNGPGMSQAIQNHIFDPFFTTKSVGKGTGMGLSISYQIVTEKHNGKLWCDSKLGDGTRFVIEIPMQLKVA
jgi:signal transduction histidine kinase